MTLDGLIEGCEDAIRNPLHKEFANHLWEILDELRALKVKYQSDYQLGSAVRAANKIAAGD